MKRAVVVSWKFKCFPQNKGISQAAKQPQCFSSGPVWPSCCHSGSQQPKAEQMPALPELQWAEGEGLVHPEPIYLYYCCTSAISQRENQQMCVIKNPWHAPRPLLSPLNQYHIPHKLLSRSMCPWLRCCGGTVSNNLSWIHHLYKLKSNQVLQMLGTVLMTTTTSLSIETEVQEKNPNIH